MGEWGDGTNMVDCSWKTCCAYFWNNFCHAAAARHALFGSLQQKATPRALTPPEVPPSGDINIRRFETNFFLPDGKIRDFGELSSSSLVISGGARLCHCVKRRTLPAHWCQKKCCFKKLCSSDAQILRRGKCCSKIILHVVDASAKLRQHLSKMHLKPAQLMTCRLHLLFCRWRKKHMKSEDLDAKP